jgi:hypothetical protein
LYESSTQKVQEYLFCIELYFSLCYTLSNFYEKNKVN